ncbi:MAG: permease-like cell division protein FtsX [Myxococcales bacterium]|nr:FtsX-like permease family protein [Myxococcales bacterium]HIK84858.1 FtsX-like permease family protein [Myxococcales bacterium]
MSRVLNLIAIAIANSVRGIRGATTTSLMAVLTISIVLVLVGSASLLVDNMTGILDEFGAELQLVAYLENDVSKQAQRELVEHVSAAPGVDRVEFVSKDEALVRFEELAGGAELLAGLDENPLPASLEIHLRPEARNADAIAILDAALDGLPGIDELAHGQEWIEGYGQAVSMVRAGALVLSMVLGLAALLIVANTIRLALYARRDELEILALVGASRTFVRVPFMMEGIFQGLLGGLFALLLIYGAFELALPQVRIGLELVLGRADLHFFSTAESISLVVLGAGLGLLGAITALVGGRT